MPALRFEVDGSPLGTLACDGAFLVALHLTGTRVDAAFADFHLGSSSRESGESRYLVYLSDVEIAPGQSLVLRFLSEGKSNVVGKTIDELYPDEIDEGEHDQDWKAIAAEAVRAARSLPRLRAGFRFWIRIGTAEPFELHSAPDDHGFGFDATWNQWRPDRLDIRFSTWTLEHDDPTRSHRHHFEATIGFGDSVEIRLDLASGGEVDG